MKQISYNANCSSRGATLVELLISILIAGALFSPMVSTFFDSNRIAFNNNKIRFTHLQAQAAVEAIAGELKTLGSGMPLGQKDFLTSTPGVGELASPILLSSGEKEIYFRRLRSGSETVLTLEFNLSLSKVPRLELEVFSSEGFREGDSVYVSNFTTGGTAAMWAIVSSIRGNRLFLESKYIASATAVFPSGSTVSAVEDISIRQKGRTIFRDEGNGEIPLIENADLNFVYYDEKGEPLRPPFDLPTIQNDLYRINIAITTSSGVVLKDIGLFEAKASRDIALRNLIVHRKTVTP